MDEITDDAMRAMLAQLRPYTLVLLRATGRRRPDDDAVVWEHGRRNFQLRAAGTLAIVCPVVDDSEWAGVGIFAAQPDEAARIMDGDPAVQAGLFAYEVHPVRGFPGDGLPDDA
jgi:hypothetical protein